MKRILIGLLTAVLASAAANGQPPIGPNAQAAERPLGPNAQIAQRVLGPNAALARKAKAEVRYPSCAAAGSIRAVPIRRGEPGYGRHFDRNGDGVACE
jgi:hypothetical protein